MAIAYFKSTDPRFQDLEGKTYGRWTVVAFCGKKNDQPRWLCRCRCGEEKELYGSNLSRGRTKSCGCLRREQLRAKKITHGLTGTKEYRAWAHCKNRCHNPASPDYPDYGGRGIKVCRRWRISFENFLADMGKAPSAKHSLDRIRVNNNYTPTNCRWVTATTQSRNRRCVPLYKFGGKSQTLPEWAEQLGLGLETLRERLLGGWSYEDAFSPDLCRPHPGIARGPVSAERIKKKRARSRVITAVKTGKLLRPDRCEKCQRKKAIQGHHHLGYDDAHVLTVRWLCPACHSREEL